MPVPNQAATLWSRHPTAEEYGPWQALYIEAVPAGDLLETMGKQTGELASMLSGLIPELWKFRYAPGKWSVLEVLGHIVDAERIAAYRAHHIARGDPQPAPGWEQEDYMRESRFEEFANGLALLDEFAYARAANLAMLKALPPDTILRQGTVNNSRMSVRGAVWVVAGHVEHHLQMLRERYGLLPQH